MVQKTFTIQVKITVDINDDLVNVDDPFDLAATICEGIGILNGDDNLFQGGKVREYGANVIGVEETNFQYGDDDE